MPETTYRLVYISRNRTAPVDVVAEIQVILDVSRRHNSELDVTGALIFNARVFAQALEGTRQGIELLFEKIQHDQRHDNLQVLGFDRIPLWSMAHCGLSPEGETLFGHIAKATGFEAGRLDADRLLNIMRVTAIEEEGYYSAPLAFEGRRLTRMRAPGPPTATDSGLRATRRSSDEFDG